MVNQVILDKLESILIDSLSKTEGWNGMSNDIEMYYKMQSLVISIFECTLNIMPPQIKNKVGGIMQKLQNTGFICEYDEWFSFLKLAQILSTSLLGDLDDKKVKDFAVPHKIMGALDAAIRLDEKQYSEYKLPEMGAHLSLGLFKVKTVVENTNWTDGWNC